MGFTGGPNEEKAGGAGRKKERGIPLYQCIREAVTKEGVLPPSFSLPHEKGGNEIRFADGAMDGMRMYHMGGTEDNIQALCDVVLLASGQQAIKAQELLSAYFADNPFAGMLTMVDDLQAFIRKNKKSLHPDELYQFSAQLLTNSDQAECIKFAIGILELMDTTEDDELQSIILTLALCDEFTLFCLFLIRSWADANQRIFEIAKKVRGWGRVHAVERLEPETQEMADWLLTEGYQSTGLAEYSVMTCIEKGGLLERLRRGSLSDRELEAAHDLICLAIEEERPVPGLNSCEDRGEELLAAYLRCIRPLPPAAPMLAAVFSVIDHFNRLGGSLYAPYLALCREIVDAPAAMQAVREAVQKGEGFAVAGRMGIDCGTQVLQAMDRDFHGAYDHIQYLLPDGFLADEVIALFEKHLPLEKMASGPEDKSIRYMPRDEHALSCILQFLRSFPGKGERLIACALLSPFIPCRNAALNSLDAWKAQDYTPSPLLKEALEKLMASEVAEDIQERLEAYR